MSRLLLLFAALAVVLSGVYLPSTWIAARSSMDANCCEGNVCCCASEAEGCCGEAGREEGGVVVSSTCECGGHSGGAFHAFGPRFFRAPAEVELVSDAAPARHEPPYLAVASLDRKAPRPPPPRF